MNVEMKPCVAIVSCCNDVLPPETIVKGILELDSDEPSSVLPISSSSLPTVQIEGVVAYPWAIANKYYEADVNICTMKCKTLGSKEFAESVNAVIICFDAGSNNGLETVEQWLPFIIEFDAEIKILVSEKCLSSSTNYWVGTDNSKSEGNSSTKITCGVEKIDAQKWCVSHGFELVELSPVTDDHDDDELEDDFPESLGMTRIIQALQAHMWPNLKLLESKPFRLESDKIGASNTICEKKSEESNDDGESSSVESKIDALMESATNEPLENFEQLFEKLSDMKLKTEGMTFEERKVYAEKMAISFWKSMGGNDSEVEGLSSDEENDVL